MIKYICEWNEGQFVILYVQHQVNKLRSQEKILKKNSTEHAYRNLNLKSYFTQT